MIAIDKIKSIFKDLTSVIDPKFISSIGAGFARTELEKPYDKIAEREFFKEIQNLPKPHQFLVQFLLYVAGAGIDKVVDEKTPVHKFIKDISIDFPSEMAKRIKQNTGGEIKAIARNKPLARLLFGLENNVLIEMSEWLSELDDEEKARAMAELSEMDEQEITKFADLTREQRSVFLKSLIAPKKGSGISAFFNRELNGLIRELEKK